MDFPSVLRQSTRSQFVDENDSHGLMTLSAFLLLSHHVGIRSIWEGGCIIGWLFYSTASFSGFLRFRSQFHRDRSAVMLWGMVVAFACVPFGPFRTPRGRSNDFASAYADLPSHCPYGLCSLLFSIETLVCLRCIVFFFSFSFAETRFLGRLHTGAWLTLRMDGSW
jgi:hypothetical protein